MNEDSPGFSGMLSTFDDRWMFQGGWRMLQDSPLDAQWHRNVPDSMNRTAVRWKVVKRGRTRRAGLTPVSFPLRKKKIYKSHFNWFEYFPKVFSFFPHFFFPFLVSVLLLKFLSTQPSNWAEREQKKIGRSPLARLGHVVRKKMAAGSRAHSFCFSRPFF